jgi:hypothetical protein
LLRSTPGQTTQQSKRRDQVVSVHVNDTAPREDTDLVSVSAELTYQGGCYSYEVREHRASARVSPPVWEREWLDHYHAYVIGRRHPQVIVSPDSRAVSA